VLTPRWSAPARPCSSFRRRWLTGAILDATWAHLEAGGVRIYPEAGYRTAFGVCLALAAGSLVMTLLVTETRCRNIWRRATH